MNHTEDEFDILLEQGRQYHIKTVTMHHVGTVSSVLQDAHGKIRWAMLQRAAWIADTGSKLQSFLRSGFNEVETEDGQQKTEYDRYPGGVLVNMSSFVDVTPWPHAVGLDSDFDAKPDTHETILAEGAKVYVRTITYHYIGQIRRVHHDASDAMDWLVITPAIWVADMGVRLRELLDGGISLAEGRRTEFEPIPYPLKINADAIIDICRWTKDIPSSAS